MTTVFASSQRRVAVGLLWVLLAIPCLWSCSTSKRLTYFQHANSVDTRLTTVLSTSTPIPLRIQANDMLAIVVSSKSEETNALFNTLNNNSITRLQYSSSGGGNQPLGYLVDVAGEVTVPLFGKVRLAGMTLDEAGRYMSGLLDLYVKSPAVNIRILNHKFTVIGEVLRPGIYNLSDTPTTLTDVIGLAGDLTVYGQRHEVQLIRTVNNKRELIQLDLTSQQILNSPYYFIENNDVLYVSARSTKTFATERAVQLLPLGLAVTSTVALLANIFLR